MDLEEMEIGLISSIRSLDDVSDLRLRGLKVDDFSFYPNIYDFICRHINDHEKLPSRKVLDVEFPEVEFEEATDDLGYLTECVINASIKRGAESAIGRGIDLLTQEDPNVAIDYLVGRLAGLKRVKKISKSYTDRDALKRYDLYIRKRKSTLAGEPLGIKTGLSALDARMIGWNPGNCILLIGYQGVGKSWYSLQMGIEGYLAKKKVLYLSPEMAVEDVEARWDTMLANRLDYELSNEAILYGRKLDQDEYKDFLEEASDRSDWITADSADGRPFDSESISALAEEYDPDLLIIDGLYLVRGNDGSIGDWQSMVQIANGLKALATRKKCVVICTSQTADSEGRIAYSRYLGQPMDFMLWMYAKPEEDENLRHIQITKMRSGKRPDKPMDIRFLPDQGILQDLSKKDS